MPWTATPYESQERGQIEQVCGVVGIPVLVIFDNKGNIIDDNGKNVVEYMVINLLIFGKIKFKKKTKIKKIKF